MTSKFINNHIHTNYSFSPYSPEDAVRIAKANELLTAGLVDHDTIAGAHEFIAAGKKYDMPVTIGVECRVNFNETKLKGKRINNPDQTSVGYLVMHSVPHKNIEAVDNYFEKYRIARNERNREMCGIIDYMISKYGMSYNFDRDVLPLVKKSCTERHVLFGLVKKIVDKYSSPEEVLSFLQDNMNVNITPSQKETLIGEKYNPNYYEYDILGILKSSLIEKIYIPAEKELPSLGEYREMVKTYDGIASYAYLGDVGNSVTGDKKAQKFEDDYLDDLFDVLKEYEFDAVTFMPTRNTMQQLNRIMTYCKANHMFQISGEDINSPRQSFICKAYENPEFGHLVDAAFTLIKYEELAEKDIKAARSLIEV